MIRALLTFRGEKRNRGRSKPGEILLRAMSPELQRIAHPVRREGNTYPSYVSGAKPYKTEKGAVARGYAARRGFRIPWNQKWRTDNTHGVPNLIRRESGGAVQFPQKQKMVRLFPVGDSNSRPQGYSARPAQF